MSRGELRVQRSLTVSRVQIAPLRAACPPTTRFIMVTATLAAPVFAQLTQEFPGILPAFGPGEHSRPFSCAVFVPVVLAPLAAPGGTCVFKGHSDACSASFVPVVPATLAAPGGACVF